MINNVAAIVEALTVGTTPTPEQLQKALNDYLPAKKIQLEEERKRQESLQ